MRKALNSLNYCSNCGQKRDDAFVKHCTYCERAWSQAPKKHSSIGTIVLCVIGFLAVAGGYIFKLVLDEASVVSRSRAYTQTEEAIVAYMKAAEVVHSEISRTIERSVASYSASNVESLSDGHYRVAVPYQGYNLQGNDATKIATCDVHCDRGLCYVDHVDGL